MSRYFFNPGCALSLYKPEMEQKILPYLNKVYGTVEPHNICCHHEPGLEPGSVIINVCAGCDRRFSNLYAGISTVSLWEVLDQSDVMPYPDYSGLKIAVHDPCPVRGKPQVHAAVRSLLRKMNIEIVETARHGAESVCCGKSFYKQGYSPEQTYTKMKERADAMPCEDVAVTCVGCVNSIAIGGKSARYLPDLLFGETTKPDGYDIVAWSQRLQEYIDAH